VKVFIINDVNVVLVVVLVLVLILVIWFENSRIVMEDIGIPFIARCILLVRDFLLGAVLKQL
jgi:hypothetical protein